MMSNPFMILAIIFGPAISIGVGWLALKAASPALRVGMGVAAGIWERFPLAYTLAGILFSIGLSPLGYGIGELNSGPHQLETEEKLISCPLSNNDICTVLRDRDVKEDNLKMMIEYMKARDEKLMKLAETYPISYLEKEYDEEPQPSYRLGWLAILGGIGVAVSGAAIFLTKIG